MIVKYKRDPKNPPRLTAEEKARLDAMTDADIDFSDAPDMSGVTGWKRPGALVATENKKQVTVRLDSDVLQFFKGTGKKYQSRMNAVLREYMLAQKRVG
jgi:uncharacterized protein (DUF4415 family)